MTAQDADQIADAVAERLAARMDSRPLLSPREVAERLGLSERTAREMIGKGTLPSIKVEGARRVEPAEVDRYIAARRGER